MRRLAVPMLAPALSEHVFLLRLQHGKPLDLLQVTGKPGLARDDGKRRSHRESPVGARVVKARLRRLKAALWTIVPPSMAEKGLRLAKLDETIVNLDVGLFGSIWPLLHPRILQGFEEIHKILGRGGFEPKRFPGDRMLEAKHRGVQSLPPEIGERRPGAVAKQRGFRPEP